jgi:hypothetical protein
MALQAVMQEAAMEGPLGWLGMLWLHLPSARDSAERTSAARAAAAGSFTVLVCFCTLMLFSFPSFLSSSHLQRMSQTAGWQASTTQLAAAADLKA